MTLQLNIPKHAHHDPAEDYATLRALGLGYIEALGSDHWTDYNLHDPGVTLLESLCYGITELAFRAGFSIPDLVALPPRLQDDPDRQAFYTARRILTMSPLTLRDYRKLLIDAEGVKNAWLAVRESYPIKLYANCQKQRLQFELPAKKPLHEVVPQGLYDVLLELDEVPGLGQPGSGKVLQSFAFGAAGRATLELRLPSWNQLEADPTRYAVLRSPTSALSAVRASRISGNKVDIDGDIHGDDLPSALRTVLFATLQVDLLADASDVTSATTLTLENVPMRVWFQSGGARQDLLLDDLRTVLQDGGVAGPLARYRAAVLAADEVVAAATRRLWGGRNLCEDFHQVGVVPLEDVAVCANLDVEPGADIEAVLAQVHDRIDQYLSPDLRFYGLNELLEAGTPAEQIFQGPRLLRGFLDDAEVDATNLRTRVFTSDIINLVADIEGVIAVRDLRLLKFDAEGRQMGPAAAWELPISEGHAPRFYALATKFLVFKEGLPFLPNAAELHDVLQVVRGRRQRPQLSPAEQDLPVERGSYRELSAYKPVQFELPRTYGVSPEGLPPSVGPERLARASQLRGYLMVFEQLLANYLSQLEHVQDLFAVDSAVEHSLFPRLIDDRSIPGVQALYQDLDAATLQGLVEGEARFELRRGRFLDHQLARFAESVNDVAMARQQQGATARDLLKYKVALLGSLPEVSYARARAIDLGRPSTDCAATPDSVDNAAGLSRRIARLLGLKPPDDQVLVIEHILLRPRSASDPLMEVCLPADCATCGEEDPYSFRLTIALSGAGETRSESMTWRRFAESVVRREVPAHLAAKVCWVSGEQREALRTAWCAWLTARSSQPPDPVEQRTRLASLLTLLAELKNIYPPATLHDCVDGNDENRVFLGRTAITAKKRE